MSVTRSTIIGGPCYATYNDLDYQFGGDAKLDVPSVWDDVNSALYGKFDKIYRDLMLKLSGVPLFYDTAQLADMFPYIAATVGTLYPGDADLTCAVASTNGDLITLTSALIGKMPDFSLGVAGVTLGAMEFWGVIADGGDPSDANSYFTMQTGQSYGNPAVPDTAVLGNQEFTASWGSFDAFVIFQAQDKWTISHELELVPVTIQGRTRGFRLASYRAMAKCSPLGPTASQIDAALAAQGGGAAGGNRLSDQSGDLVIVGSNSMTVTIGNAGMVGEGFVFGSKQLRQGEVGWISNLLIADGGVPADAALTLA